MMTTRYTKLLDHMTLVSASMMQMLPESVVDNITEKAATMLCYYKETGNPTEEQEAVFVHMCGVAMAEVYLEYALEEN